MSSVIRNIEAIDHRLLNVIVAYRKIYWTRFMRLLTRLGDGQLWFVVVLALTFLHIEHIRVFVHASFAFLIELTVYKLFKTYLPRMRPCELLPYITRLILPPDKNSFPSGHTAAAFVMVLLIATYAPVLFPVFLLLAIGIGLSRIYLGVHFPTDVLAGVFLGITSGIVSKFLTNIFFTIY